MFWRSIIVLITRKKKGGKEKEKGVISESYEV